VVLCIGKGILKMNERIKYLRENAFLLNQKYFQREHLEKGIGTELKLWDEPHWF